MLYDLTYQEALAKADSLKDIGHTRIFLHDKFDARPWYLVKKVKPGAGYRMGIPTSVDFSATNHGLEFAWSMDLETREANGKGTFEIDTEVISAVMDAIPKGARAQLAALLRTTAKAVEEKGDEYRDAANQQYNYGETLRRVATLGD